MIAINRPDDLIDDRPIFEPGELVSHKRYGYRGVVVARDECCKADDEWYAKNQTQPDRDQPWYHVLVNNSATCTYAAATSLMPDPNKQPIQHPLLSYFFSGFKDGSYVRNDKPWPG